MNPYNPAKQATMPPALRRSLELLEARTVPSAMAVLDPDENVLYITGTAAADKVQLDYGLAVQQVDDLVMSIQDYNTIRVRIQTEASTGQEFTFPADAIDSVIFSGEGGIDLLLNRTSKPSSWSTTDEGIVNTSLLIGSPGYSNPTTDRTGVFTVGPTGQVSVDYLFRGAGYSGQLGIYSLAGMEGYQPGSPDYHREATRRALSGSTLGHVVINARAEGAKYSASLPWERDFNNRTYQGPHLVSMTPGDKFGVFIIPNGTVEQVYQQPNATGSLTPLYSTPEANPYPAKNQFRSQLGDLDGAGNLFGFEDLRLDGSSDRDYNDFVFQVTGAYGESSPVAEVVNPSRNFLEAAIFDKIETYAMDQAQDNPVATAASHLPGTLVVGPDGTVKVNLLDDQDPTAGEVALFSMKGMWHLEPGSPAFVEEAARRALSESTQGRVITSDDFQTDANTSNLDQTYYGWQSVEMTPGDTLAAMYVPEGTVWDVYLDAVQQTNPTVLFSIPTESGGGDMQTSTSGSETSEVILSFHDASGTYDGMVLGIQCVTPGGESIEVTGTGTLRGVVYLDQDGDQQASLADTFLPDMVVILTGIDLDGNQVMRTTWTDSRGCYHFGDLPVGTYQIQAADLTATTLSGTAGVGGLGGTVAGDTITEIQLDDGAAGHDYMLGRHKPGVLSGLVYADLNQDRVHGNDETGIAGVTIHLAGTDDHGTTIESQVTTGTNGRYAFMGLRPGTYSIRQSQPDNWVDGRQTIGSFLGQSDPLPRNGTIDGNGFKGIQLHAAEFGHGYNFGEWLVNKSSGQYLHQQTLLGTPGTDVVEVIIGKESTLYRINGQAVDIVADSHVVFQGGGGQDQVRITGSDEAEQMTISPGFAKLINPGLRLEFQGVPDVSFAGGQGDRVFLYDTPDDDQYSTTPRLQQLIGPNYRASVTGAERVYAYAFAGGTDTALLEGSAGRDTFKGGPANARLYGSGYYHFTTGFDTVTALPGSGGIDKASFYDGVGNDQFMGSPTIASLEGSGYRVEVLGFDQVDTFFEQGGSDRGTLSGSHGDDRFFFDAQDAQLTGTGFDLRSHGTAMIIAVGNGGYDKADFEGTLGDDQLTASPYETRLVGPEIDVTAFGFESVKIIGSCGCHSTDIARLSGGSGNDRFEAKPGFSQLRGENYRIRLEGFSQVTATAGPGGDDLAVLTGSPGDDILEETTRGVRLTTGSQQFEALGFGAFTFDGNGGNDETP